MVEYEQKTQGNSDDNEVKCQSDTNTDSIQNQDPTRQDEADMSTGAVPPSSDPSKGNEEGTKPWWKSVLSILIIILIIIVIILGIIGIISGIIGIISGIILSNLFGSVVGICLAVSLCICAIIVFCYCAYKCLQKDKLSCIISWLVGLFLLFILIIVLGLFANTFSGFSVMVSSDGNFKGSTITLTSVLLFILSIFISILSGYIVHKKDEEKKQKQRNMEYEIEAALNELYEKGE